MSGITLEQAQEKLAGWLDADTRLQSNQEVRHDGRVLRRSDAMEVRNNIDYWDKKCKELEAAGNTAGRSRTVSANW
jgi:hypothetical protein